ncbi:1396_t:CDS:2 [Paraglomus brasilianum]|uniref:1396_t:CDS:1 n=1 Tax=Paraglomus brasilianum TaxID=144538 RepID=A0A9N8ZIA9_9GLOM|nr:1396_t:CDS:2 [Paraglomus brasilianum]
MKYAVESILNFRDVGTAINDFPLTKDMKKIKCGILFRGGKPDEADDADIKRLVDYGIKTIIDMRSSYEPVNSTFLSNAYVITPYPPPQPLSLFDSESNKSNDGTEEREKHFESLSPCGKIIQLNFTGRNFERYVIGTAPWLLKLKIFGYFLTCQRKEAARTVGREVTSPRGLSGMYVDFANGCHQEICTLLDIISDDSNLPVYIHCTLGKDRTGFIIALILGLCGVDEEAIVHDYCLSQKGLFPRYSQVLKGVANVGLTDDFAEAPPEAIRKLFAYIRETYGSVSEYLTAIGCPPEKQELVKRNIYG